MPFIFSPLLQLSIEPPGLMLQAVEPGGAAPNTAGGCALASDDEVVCMFHDSWGSSRLMHSLVADTNRSPQPWAAEQVPEPDVPE